jgi:hypothetical protein
MRPASSACPASHICRRGEGVRTQVPSFDWGKMRKLPVNLPIRRLGPTIGSSRTGACLHPEANDKEQVSECSATLVTEANRRNGPDVDYFLRDDRSNIRPARYSRAGVTLDTDNELLRGTNLVNGLTTKTRPIAGKIPGERLFSWALRDSNPRPARCKRDRLERCAK